MNTKQHNAPVYVVHLAFTADKSPRNRHAVQAGDRR